MSGPHETLPPADGRPLSAEDARRALSGAELVYDDGAIQQFTPDGATTYLDAGNETTGTWSVDDDGTFSSFWPPSFRASYALSWRVAGQDVGLTFVSHRDGSVFSGRFSTLPG